MVLISGRHRRRREVLQVDRRRRRRCGLRATRAALRNQFLNAAADRPAGPARRAILLVVAAVLAGLRYTKAELFKIIQE